MKKYLLLSSALVIGLIAAPPVSAAQINKDSTLIDITPETDFAAAPRFTKVIDDLPLMPGLEVVPEDDVLFAEPNGRIADTTAQGEVDVDAVYDFYRNSLPQLGWSKVDARSYSRGNDYLHIDAHAEGKVTTVRFSVKPAK